MTLLRATARTLLASQFVVSGFKALRDPQPLVPAAEPLVDRWLPVVQKYAPDQVVDYIPTDTTTLVRVNGALELVGGLALATGKGRRVGSVLLAISLVPTTVAKYPFWTRELPEDKATDRALFLKNVSLLGGVVLAARDTEGKPGLAWLAQSGTQAIVKDTTKAGRRVAKNTSQLTDAALGGGAALVGAAVSQSAKARKKAAKRAARLAKNTSYLTDAAMSGGTALVGAAAAQSASARKKAAKAMEAARSAAEKRAAAAAAAAAKKAKENAKQDKLDAKQAKRDNRLAAKQEKQDAVEAKIVAKQQKQDAKQAKKDAVLDKKAAAEAAAIAKQNNKAAKQAEKEARAAQAASAKNLELVQS